jgi:non-ribosomal peptide synthetase component E (peptide arylation enzyme)
LGGRLILNDRFDAVDTMGFIEQHRVTIFDGVPTMHLFMLADSKL